MLSSLHGHIRVSLDVSEQHNSADQSTFSYEESSVLRGRRVIVFLAFGCTVVFRIVTSDP